MGLFSNGARFGLRLDPGKVNPGSIRARISVAKIGWMGGLMPLYLHTRRAATPEGRPPLWQRETYSNACGKNFEDTRIRNLFAIFSGH